MERLIFLGALILLFSCAGGKPKIETRMTKGEKPVLSSKEKPKSSKVDSKKPPVLKNEIPLANGQEEKEGVNDMSSEASGPVEDSSEPFPAFEFTDCRENLSVQNSEFKDCLFSLEPALAKQWIEENYLEEDWWALALRNRMMAYHYLNKNGEKELAGKILDDLLARLDQLEPFRREALEWKFGEAEAQELQRERWGSKLKEVENALRMGKTHPEIEEKLLGWEKNVLSVEQASTLDSLLTKSKEIDQGRMKRYWEEAQSEVSSPEEKQKAKNRLLTKYAYLLTEGQKKILAGGGDQKEADAYCEARRKEASQWVIRARRQKKKDLLEKALLPLQNCLEKYPESSLRPEVESSVERLKQEIAPSE